MPWLLLAALTALFESFKDLLAKRGVRHMDPLLVAWAWMAGALPFLWPWLLLTETPPIHPPFWWAVAGSGLINVVAFTLYVRALHLGELSLTVPMLTFTPLFMLLTSPLILGEWPSPGGLAGVALIVAGGYLLNLGERRHGWLAPLTALARHPGPRHMLLVAAIWSISANLDKVGVVNASPLLYGVTVFTFMAAVMTPLVWWRLGRREMGAALRRHGGLVLLIGALAAAAVITQMTAVQLTLAAYVIAIKRTNALLAVAWGGLFLGEGAWRGRLLPAAIMCGGVALVALA